MARYSVNRKAVAHARKPIEGKQCVLHLLAAEWQHTEIELAAHKLLQLLDKTAG